MDNDVTVAAMVETWFIENNKTPPTSACKIAYARIHRYVDNGHAFYPLMSYAGVLGKQNVVIGFAMIGGKLTMIIANEPTIKAGAMSKRTIEAIQRALDIVLKLRLPVVFLAQTAGLDLTDSGSSYLEIGGVFQRMTKIQSQGIPSIVVVYGTCTAGGAYIVGLTDYAIFIRKDAFVFLAGPELVFTAIGERTTPEKLGGCEVHQSSGLADVVCEDEDQAVGALKCYLQSLSWPDYQDSTLFRMFSCSKITALLSDWMLDDLIALPMKKIMTLITDDSWVYKAGYGDSLACYFARVADYHVGIIASNGPIDAASCHKTCQFIEKCVTLNRPLLFLMNTPGFQVGTRAEESGIIVAGSRLIQHISNAPVSKITLQVGAGFGAGYYAMCGRPFVPDIVLSWPCAQIGVMGAKQISQLMLQLKIRQAKRRGEPCTSAQKKAIYESFFQHYEPRLKSRYTTSKLWDDGIIRPEETKSVLTFLLAVFAHSDDAPKRELLFGLSRV